MLRLEPSALMVESFPAVDVVEFKGEPGASPSHLPMCTCQSCTDGFPDCDTGQPKVCQVATAPTAPA